jgi:hypothetical protein
MIFVCSQYSADKGNVEAQTAVAQVLNYGTFGIRRDHALVWPLGREEAVYIYNILPDRTTGMSPLRVSSLTSPTFARFPFIPGIEVLHQRR